MQVNQKNDAFIICFLTNSSRCGPLWARLLLKDPLVARGCFIAFQKLQSISPSQASVINYPHKMLEANRRVTVLTLTSVEP